MSEIVPNNAHIIGPQLELLIPHLRGVYRTQQPSKSKKRRKNNKNQTPLRTPTALYSHFGDPTWITFMFVMVLRTFCAPHILSWKRFFYVVFLLEFSTLTASTAQNKQNKAIVWISILFPLTLPSKCAISELGRMKKIFDFFSVPLTLRTLTPT